MRQKMGWYLFALLFLSGLTLLFASGAKAGSTYVTVTPNAQNATVAVTVSDSELNGKEISVICYAPGIQGAVGDITANKKSLVYMNQYTVNGTVSFSFPVKKQLVQGIYTLVVASEKGQTVNQFRFLQDSSDAPAGTVKPADPKPAPPAVSKSNTKKKLAAPAGVKAKAKGKKKVKVTWKKVKGAKGYLIRTASKKNGKYKVVRTVKGGAKKQVTLTGMKKGKICYIKVSAYRLSGKKKIAGKNSKAVKVKVR